MISDVPAGHLLAFDFDSLEEGLDESGLLQGNKVYSEEEDQDGWEYEDPDTCGGSMKDPEPKLYHAPLQSDHTMVAE